MATSTLSVTAHPVKVERHDVSARKHHTNTGVRAVHTYRATPHGLFVARHFEAHPRIRHWQAHLLPHLNVVVCHYEFHGAREHDYHLDVARISREGHVWVVRDLYLDVIVHEGRAAELVDEDELSAAHAAGFIDGRETRQARLIAQGTLSGLRQAGCRVQGWLAAQGVSVDWLRAPASLRA